MKNIISENEKTWDKVADQFVEACFLPAWGPMDIGKDLKLIKMIRNKIFLEVGCGSGRSIKYLINKGAKKIYGLDFSQKQIDEATRHNKASISKNKVVLIKSVMENKIKIEPVDFVYSVYALGWTDNPKATLKNIYSYLKPGGLLIWSWDHAFFSDVEYKDGKCVVVHSYHEENLIEVKNWKKSGSSVHVTYRKTSTWFRLLTEAGFEIVEYYEPEPNSSDKSYNNPNRYYSIQKAQKVPCSFIFVCKKK